MSVSKIIAEIGVNLLAPLLGVLVYVLLCRRMQRANIQSPPGVQYALLFLTYGGWLLVLLTSLFWEWSGMASLGVFYLVLAAPFIMAGAAFSLRRSYGLSVFHRVAFISSIVYSALAVIALGVSLAVHFFAR
jgi:hypothetical protein